MFTAIALTMLLAQEPQPVTLSRVMKTGQKFAYKVSGRLTTETKQLSQGIETYMPEDVLLEYDCFYDVLKEKADGIADIKYRRPFFKITVPDPTGKLNIQNDKIDMSADITLSPINEFLQVKDTTPKKPETKKNDSKLFTPATANAFASMPAVQGDLIGQILGDLQRLSLFMGTLDFSMEFQPKLHFDDVKVGDTWKRTAGSSPQKLDSKDGKSVMQRLDMVYTYKGKMVSNGQTVERVTATIDLKANMMDFLKDTYGNQAKDFLAELKEFNYNLNATIDFDLDPKTYNTLYAENNAKGNLVIILKQLPDRPFFEQKLTGRTTLRPIAK
jgi:hypothetical protein